MEQLLNLQFVPNIFLQFWWTFDNIAIVVNLSGKLKKTPTIGEECRYSVSNVTAIVVCCSKGQIVCHLHGVAVGKGENLQLKGNLKGWTPRWNYANQFVIFNLYFSTSWTFWITGRFLKFILLYHCIYQNLLQQTFNLASIEESNVSICRFMVIPSKDFYVGEVLWIVILYMNLSDTIYFHFKEVCILPKK